MNIEGQLSITLACENAEVNQVHIRSSRPLDAVKLLVGKTPEQGLAAVPLLFNICGNAQAYAAHSALSRALDIRPEPAADLARQMLVMLETVREHGWRIVLDWSRLLGRESDGRQFADVLKLIRRIKPMLFEQGEAFRIDSRLDLNYPALDRIIDELENLVDELIFQGGMQSWLMLKTEAQLLNWLKHNSTLPASLISYIYRQSWQDIGHNTIACLPELDINELQHQLSHHSTFSRNPEWLGDCFETGPFSRQQSLPLLVDLTARYRNGLLSRIVARLSELASTTTSLRQMLAQLDGAPSRREQVTVDRACGLAQVQAVRGLLIHSVRITEARIDQYQIVAPTEWNFHPGGVVAESLKQLRATDRSVLKQQADWLINVIDPCVRYRIEITTDELG